MTADRRQLLLAVLFFLIFVKFVGLPWLDWQSDKRQQLMVLTQRLDRSVGVVANADEIIKARAALRAEVKQLESLFPTVKALPERKLQAQRAVEEIAAQNGLTVSSFDWVFQSETGSDIVPYARARIQLAGDLRSLALTHGSIESKLPGITIRDLLVTPNGLAKDPLAKPSTMSVTVDFYFLEIAQ